MIFYTLAFYRMYHNVSQFTNAESRAERCESIMHVRIETSTLDGLRQIASRESRTPSNLARKVITDFVRGGQLHAVPPPPAVQSAQTAPQSSTPSPWDI